MSRVTSEILEKLKTITLPEVKELVSQIEETFGVNASSIDTTGKTPVSTKKSVRVKIPRKTEKTTFNVVLGSITEEKRVAALKVIRSLTRLGLKEAKDFCTDLPRAVKEGVNKVEAVEAKRKLEEVGRRVNIK